MEILAVFPAQTAEGPFDALEDVIVSLKETHDVIDSRAEVDFVASLEEDCLPVHTFLSRSFKLVVSLLEKHRRITPNEVGIALRFKGERSVTDSTKVNAIDLSTGEKMRNMREVLRIKQREPEGDDEEFQNPEEA